MKDFTGPYTFLTTKPSQRLFSMDHPEWLYICPNEEIASAQLTVIIMYSDASKVVITIALGTLKLGEVQCLDISNKRRNYNQYNPTKSISKITIYISDIENDHLILRPYTPQSDQILAIYYHNSYGGMDSLICLEDQQESIEMEGIVTAKPIDAAYDESSAQFIYNDGKFRSSVSTISGMLPKKELFALKDLFIIKKAWQYTEDSDNIKSLIPLIPESQSVVFPSGRNNVKKLAINFRYAFDEMAISRIV